MKYFLNQTLPALLLLSFFCSQGCSKPTEYEQLLQAKVHPGFPESNEIKETTVQSLAIGNGTKSELLDSLLSSYQRTHSNLLTSFQNELNRTEQYVTIAKDLNKIEKDIADLAMSDPKFRESFRFKALEQLKNETTKKLTDFNGIDLLDHFFSEECKACTSLVKEYKEYEFQRFTIDNPKLLSRIIKVAISNLKQVSPTSCFKEGKLQLTPSCEKKLNYCKHSYIQKGNSGFFVEVIAKDLSTKIIPISKPLDAAQNTWGGSNLTANEELDGLFCMAAAEAGVELNAKPYFHYAVQSEIISRLRPFRPVFNTKDVQKCRSDSLNDKELKALNALWLRGVEGAAKIIEENEQLKKNCREKIQQWICRDMFEIDGNLVLTYKTVKNTERNVTEADIRNDINNAYGWTQADIANHRTILDRFNACRLAKKYDLD